MQNNTFQCASCGGVFPKARSDIEAEAEFKEKFGRDMNPSSDTVVCEDCYQRIMADTGPIQKGKE